MISYHTCIVPRLTRPPHGPILVTFQCVRAAPIVVTIQSGVRLCLFPRRFGRCWLVLVNRHLKSVVFRFVVCLLLIVVTRPHLPFS